MRILLLALALALLASACCRPEPGKPCIVHRCEETKKVGTRLMPVFCGKGCVVLVPRDQYMCVRTATIIQEVEP